MGLRELFVPRTDVVKPASTDYIDLEEYTTETTDEASMMVRVAEINKYDDLRECANYVYSGNLLLLDFAGVAGDEVVLKRVTNDLKKLVEDIDGDIAGLGKTMMIIAPTGVKIDRNKMRGF